MSMRLRGLAPLLLLAPGAAADALPDKRESLPIEIFAVLDECASSAAAMSTVRAWLEEGGDVDAREPAQGGTMLHWAAARDNLGLAKLVLEFGAAVNIKADKKPGSLGPTPLILATGKGHIELVKLLLAQGADPDGTDDKGVSALRYAEAEERRIRAQHKHAEHGEHVIARLLREAKQRLAALKDEM